MMGSDPSYPYVYRAFEKYAKKVNADLICSTSPHYVIEKDIPGGKLRDTAWFEKIYINELLKQYDRVLYIDADILITPDAPDIFSLFPKEDHVYMLNEGLHANREKQIQQISALLPLGKNWVTEKGEPFYYNAGVMLISQQCNFFAYVDQKEFLKLCTRVSMYDQTYFNYLMLKHNINVENLPKEFNRLSLFGEENYLQGYFIHYAGGGYCRSIKLRYRTIIEDYQKLYNDPHSAIEKYLVRRLADIKFLGHEVKRGILKLKRKICAF
jgi:lipopolysaccharide biosynthesis glycosyltransferase